MGVLAAKARKTLLLTGTLMGGYGDDLFHLLFRALPGRMIEDCLLYTSPAAIAARARLSPAAEARPAGHNAGMPPETTA